MNNEIKRTRGKLVTSGSKAPRYVAGTNDKGPYEFIATGVDVDGKVHDITFALDKWDEIAQSSAPSTTVFVTGVLTTPKNPYTVFRDDPKRAYVRMKMVNAELDDLVDTKGSALAFRRGARRPSSAQLKAMATSGMDIPDLEEGTPEEPAATNA